jgi:gliding motility-associated-like protein
MNAIGAGPGFTIGGNVDSRTAGTEGLTAFTNGYRKVKIDMSPNGAGTGFILNVWVLEGTSSGGINHHLINNYSYIGNTLPANLSYGFAGSTGGATNFHEIRNLNISLPEPELSVPVQMSLKGLSLKNEPFTTKPDTEVTATNLISPNGDSKNDTWVIRNIEKYPNNLVRVFDRLGRLVYSTTNYNNSWDGFYQGAVLPVDTYYYIIELPNSGQHKRGFISLVH